jgi:hypothetical protein
MYEAQQEYSSQELNEGAEQFLLLCTTGACTSQDI